LSILWPLKKSLRSLGKGGGALLLPMVVWLIAGRIGVAEAAVNMLSTGKKMVRNVRDEGEK
jgi:hypothetical protein